MRNKLVIFGAVNLVIAVGGWFLLVAPQRSSASTAAEKLQQTQSEIAQVSIPPMRHQPVIRTADLYRLAQAMPLSADEPDLMLALDQLARASGVKVGGISPGTPAAQVGGYSQLPITLTVMGSYGSLTRYLHRLRTLVSVHGGSLIATGRLVAVTNVAVSPAGVGKEESATVSLEAFVYGTPAGATPLPSTSTTSTTTTTG